MDADTERRDIVERLLQPMSNDPSEVQRERFLAAQEITRLRAQPSPREVALPLEPTAEMLSAGGAVYDHPNVYMGGPSARGRRLAGRAYKAMIEAALHGREDQP